jgi:HAD superfamily hydrolase (TIGR01490 family)
MARPFAVFDIDGTIIRWQLYHALADELAREGYLDPKQFQKVRAARMNWKKRGGEDSFTEYEQTLINLVNSAITNVRVADLEEASKRVLNEYKDQVYTYTRDLINQLRAKNYLLFTISASQAEIVGMLAKYYGFDDWAGSAYEARDGFFTGHIDLLISQRKPERLKELVAKHNATWQGSIGVGDSESDIALLETVEKPIAFNPTKQLFEHAQKNDWKVVLERKNMVYELESHDGQYRLTD